MFVSIVTPDLIRGLRFRVKPGMTEVKPGMTGL